jgi:hypothetical protein
VIGGMHFGEDAGRSLVRLPKKIVAQALVLAGMAHGLFCDSKVVHGIGESIEEWARACAGTR